MNKSIITFEPIEHKYTNQYNEEYISVTTLLGKEFPFNDVEIAERVRHFRGSRYYGMSVKRILRLWEDSSKHGNVVHNMIEDYIKDDVVPSDKSLMPLLDQYKRINFRGEILSETLLWDDEYKIAGMVDILEVLDDCIYIYDIKTSIKVSDSKLTKFSLQLELYKRMAEKQFNKEARLGYILHFADYVTKRSNTKLKLIGPLHLGDIMDEILEKRKKEISC